MNRWGDPGRQARGVDLGPPERTELPGLFYAAVHRVAFDRLAARYYTGDSLELPVSVKLASGQKRPSGEGETARDFGGPRGIAQHTGAIVEPGG